MFPDEFVHIGADEMNRKCWSEDSTTMHLLRSKGLNPKQAESMFIRENVKTLTESQRIAIVWQDAMDSSVINAKDVVVMTWKCWGNPTTIGEQSAKKWLSMGVPVIKTDCFYLDWDTNWNFLYKQNIDERVLGGEAAMWTERVDFTNLECRLWPRAFVVAERLWQKETENEKDFAIRLSYHQHVNVYDVWIQNGLKSSSTLTTKVSCPLLESQSIQRDMNEYSRFLSARDYSQRKVEEIRRVSHNDEL